MTVYPKQPNKIYICPHIHWDREWIANEPVSQQRLTYVLDQIISLLEKTDYPSIFLDGQTGIISDYLEHNTDKQERFLFLAAQYRLKLGMWYYQPDLNIPGGEATIRNLLLGKQALDSYGQTTKIAYLPDSFGHFSQLPQILQGFGVSVYYFGRGMGSQGESLGQLFWWNAPNGSRVLAFHIFPSSSYARGTGYDETGKLNLELVFNQVQSILSIQKKTFNSTIHLYTLRDPTTELPQIYEEIQKQFPDYDVEYTDLEDIFSQGWAEQAKVGIHTYQGELRYGKYYSIFPGTYSSRIHVKQSNVLLEAKLEILLEPLCTFADWEGYAYPKDSIKSIWKLLIKNHFHDAISGTSIDAVYDDVNYRNRKIDDISDYLIQDRLKFFCKKIGLDQYSVLVVYNPHPYSTNAMMNIEICLPMSWKNTPINLFDTENNSISPIILGSEYRYEHNDLRFPTRLFLKLQFLATNLPPCGMRFYRILPDTTKKEPTKAQQPSLIETESLKIAANENGSLDIFDTQGNAVMHDVGVLVDEADLGDLYSFMPSKDRKKLTSSKIMRNVLVADEDVLIKVSNTLEWKIPISLDNSGKQRSTKKKATHINTQVKIWKSKPWIDFTIKIDNQSKDHRLGVQIPTNIKASNIQVLRQFAFETMPINIQKQEDWIETPAIENLTNGVIWIHDSFHAIAIITLGLLEYQSVIDENGNLVIQLTLLRSVGWLSKPNLTVRSGPAGPCIPTPQAQMLGGTEAKFALLIDEWNITNIVRLANIYRCPPVAFQTNIFEKPNLFQRPWRNIPNNFDETYNDSAQMEDISFCTIDGVGLVVSSIKNAENGIGYILRVFNVLNEASVLKASFRDHFEYWLTSLDENDRKYLGKGQSITVPIKSHEILSVFFTRV